VGHIAIWVLGWLPLDGQLTACGRAHIQRHGWRWGCNTHSCRTTGFFTVYEWGKLEHRPDWWTNWITNKYIYIYIYIHISAPDPTSLKTNILTEWQQIPNTVNSHRNHHTLHFSYSFTSPWTTTPACPDHLESYPSGAVTHATKVKG
jgi:hypothetical protein